jgi:predicted RNase H-like HicB family nuclease
MKNKKIKQYDVIIEQDEDKIYVAHVPELPGCHTQGETLEEVTQNIKEAIELYLEYKENKIENPMKFIAVKKVEVAMIS